MVKNCPLIGYVMGNHVYFLGDCVNFWLKSGSSLALIGLKHGGKVATNWLIYKDCMNDKSEVSCHRRNKSDTIMPVQAQGTLAETASDL